MEINLTHSRRVCLWVQCVCVCVCCTWVGGMGGICVAWIVLPQTHMANILWLTDRVKKTKTPHSSALCVCVSVCVCWSASQKKEKNASFVCNLSQSYSNSVVDFAAYWGLSVSTAHVTQSHSKSFVHFITPTAAQQLRNTEDKTICERIKYREHHPPTNLISVRGLPLQIWSVSLHKWSQGNTFAWKHQRNHCRRLSNDVFQWLRIKWV